MMATEIVVDKEDPLVDEVIIITVNGLQQNEQITVRAEVTERGQVFAGSGCFVADDNGSVDLSTQPSASGTYKGVSPMGLFWSMRPSPGMPYGSRLIKSNASSPLVTDLTVFPGHLTFEETYSATKRQLCNRKIRRWYMAKGVQKRKIRSGRIRGTLFLPPGKGPFPGIIDMFGVAGSCIEFRAALLASRGFASIALPYFFYEDLPKSLFDLEFEYFMEAVDWFSAQPSVDGNKIGVLGVSKGGEVALQLGFHSDKLKSVVSINGAPIVSSVPMLYKGQPLDTIPYDADGRFDTEEGSDFTNTTACDVSHFIPIWTKDVNVLLVCGLDDRCVSPKFLKALWECYPAHRKHLCTLCSYTGAGHLIEPPYSPFTRTSRSLYRKEDNKVDAINVLWGGETVAHARAQEDAGTRILDHFRTTLQTTKTRNDLQVSKL